MAQKRSFREKLLLAIKNSNYKGGWAIYNIVENLTVGVADELIQELEVFKNWKDKSDEVFNSGIEAILKDEELRNEMLEQLSEISRNRDRLSDNEYSNIKARGMSAVAYRTIDKANRKWKITTIVAMIVLAVLAIVAIVLTIKSIRAEDDLNVGVYTTFGIAVADFLVGLFALGREMCNDRKKENIENELEKLVQNNADKGMFAEYTQKITKETNVFSNNKIHHCGCIVTDNSKHTYTNDKESSDEE